MPDNENLRITHGPWLQNMTSTGVTIMWTTNRAAVPGIILLEKGSTQRLVRNSTSGIINAGGVVHKVRLEGLKPGTTYSYKLNSVQILKYQAYRIYYGDTLNTATLNFTTYPESPENVRFLVINDVHENSGKLSSYLKNTTLPGNSLVFFNGDMVDFLQDPGQLFAGFIDTARRYFASSVPFYYVRGNHETRGYRAREIADYFDNPGKSYYYSFDIGKTHFIVLDCGEDKPDNNRYYYGLADYDTYRKEELDWLRADVAGSSFRNAEKRIVIVHFPILKQDNQGYGMKFLADNFGPVLQKAGINLMISAHTHRNSYYDRDQSGFGYPLLVNSNNSFVEVSSGRSEIRCIVKDLTGKVINEYSIK
ncbi:MAG: metallophosphoesterase family protein [Bacteroidales bacterium]